MCRPAWVPNTVVIWPSRNTNSLNTNQKHPFWIRANAWSPSVASAQTYLTVTVPGHGHCDCWVKFVLMQHGAVPHTYTNLFVVSVTFINYPAKMNQVFPTGSTCLNDMNWRCPHSPSSLSSMLNLTQKSMLKIWENIPIFLYQNHPRKFN